jgi:hypothetical protein
MVAGRLPSKGYSAKFHHRQFPGLRVAAAWRCLQIELVKYLAAERHPASKRVLDFKG